MVGTRSGCKMFSHGLFTGFTPETPFKTNRSESKTTTMLGHLMVIEPLFLGVRMPHRLQVLNCGEVTA